MKTNKANILGYIKNLYQIRGLIYIKKQKIYTDNSTDFDAQLDKNFTIRMNNFKNKENIEKKYSNKEDTNKSLNLPNSNEISFAKLEKFLDELNQKKYKKVSFLLGAGISTAAGIPDFRSKDGLYSQIKGKYKIENPSDLFNISYFWNNPEVYYSYLKTVIGKTHFPTNSHFFVKKFQDEEILNVIYTQNVDALEIKAGINSQKIIFAHGRRDKCICSKCKLEHSFQRFIEHINTEQVLYCDYCKGPCKTSVVFFGESLSNEFYENRNVLYNSDLIFIIGTSLTVKPFSYLLNSIKKDTMIVMINKESLLDNKNIINNVKKIYLGDQDKGNWMFDLHRNPLNEIKLLNIVGESDKVVEYIINNSNNKL